MTHNDILRGLRFGLSLSDQAAADLFSQDPANAIEMSKAGFLARIAKPEDAHHKELSDPEFAAFLDGLIVSKRGLRDGAPTSRPSVTTLTKNEVLKKLRVALTLRDDDLIKILAAGGSQLSKSELSALFRKPDHKHYRTCGNQVMRAFLKGLATLKP
ncbi:MAG: DUF1456 family protein [Pseudomonadota bacterium]